MSGSNQSDSLTFAGAVSDVEMQEHYDEFFEVCKGAVSLDLSPQISYIDVVHSTITFRKKPHIFSGVHIEHKTLYLIFPGVTTD